MGVFFDPRITGYSKIAQYAGDIAKFIDEVVEHFRGATPTAKQIAQYITETHPEKAVGQTLDHLVERIGKKLYPEKIA